MHLVCVGTCDKCTADSSFFSNLNIGPVATAIYCVHLSVLGHSARCACLYFTFTNCNSVHR